jgi:hypothetical protein
LAMRTPVASASFKSMRTPMPKGFTCAWVLVE